MAQHIGIVGCSAPGGALCYETICMESGALAGENQARPEVSMHTHPFSEYMRRIKAGDWQVVAELMLSSAEKLASIGAEFVVAPCNTIHLAFESVFALISIIKARAMRQSSSRRLSRECASATNSLFCMSGRKTGEPSTYVSDLASLRVGCYR